MNKYKVTFVQFEKDIIAIDESNSIFIVAETKSEAESVANKMKNKGEQVYIEPYEELKNV